MRLKKMMACLLCAAMAVPAVMPGMAKAADAPKKEQTKAAVSVEKVDLSEETQDDTKAEKPQLEKNVLPPQMGWSTWNFFREQVDESKIMDAANAMVSTGLADAGYVYLNIDDCWQSSMRSSETGSMMFDLDNFPSGPQLIDKLHDMGLKVGLYSSSGELTCEDLPGSYGKEAIDARAFAEWGIDYLKYDYCHVVDLPTDAQGGQDFSGLTTAPDVDYISVTPYSGTEGGEAGKKIKIEAEAPEVEKKGSLTVQNEKKCSGGQFVTGLSNNGGDLIFKNVNVDQAGKYLLTIGHRKTYSARGRYAEVLVNGDNRYEAHITRSSGWSPTARHQLVVDLQAGNNEILIHNPLTGQQTDSVRRYTNMGKELQKATAAVAAENGTEERPIFFSICEHGRSAPWDWAAGIGNSWRTSHDISANWNSVVSCYESSVSHWDKQVPGSYNDPDMMQVGNGNLSETENKAHFTLWSMLSAPLILGNDIRNFVTEEGEELTGKEKQVFDIVTNEEIIALNQDVPLLQCKRISTENGMDILVKPLQNQETGEAEVAVCFFNKSGKADNTASVDLDTIAEKDSRLKDLKWNAEGVYSAKELWTGEEAVIDGQFTSGKIPQHGVEVYRISPAKEGSVEKLAKLSLGADDIYTAKEEQVVKVELTNLGKTEIENVRLSLEAPKGVTVTEKESKTVDSLQMGEKAVAEFHVTFPEMKSKNQDAYVDLYDLKTKATFNYKGETEKQEKAASASVKVSEPVIAKSGDTVKLGDANWLKTTTGWPQGPTKRNKSVNGNSIKINGKTFESGIGVHATSDTDIYLGGNAAKFTATVGVDDEVKGYEEQWAPSVTFIVLADGKEVARTEELKFGESAQLSVDVPKCKILTLRADEGAANSSDHAGWGDATLTWQEPAVTHKVTVPSKVEGGSVASTPKDTVKDGEDVMLTFTPSKGYELKTATVNDADVTKEVKVDENGVGTYVVKNVKADVAVTAVFAKKEVKPEDKEVASVKELEKEVVYGIQQDALELPKEVTAVLKNGEEVKAAVAKWECADYKAWTEGTYTFQGTLAESEAYGNAGDVKATQEVEVKLPSENIAPFAKATAPDGAAATQDKVTKKPEWVNDKVYDDEGRPKKDGVFAFATPLSEKSYFNLNWETPVAVDRVVLNTYFADEQGPTSFDVSVQYGDSEKWEKVGSQTNIKWPVHDGRKQYQSEIKFEKALENVTAMRVKVNESNTKWGVSVVTEFEVFGRELCPVTVDPANGTEAQSYFVPKGSWLNLQNPVWDGHVFQGWFTDKEYKNPYVPAAVQEEVHLFAKWIEESEELFSVTVAETKNGKISIPAAEYKAGDEVPVTVEPAEGYQLKEGSLKANDTVIEGNKFVMPKEDVVVTAEFEKVDGGDVDPEEPQKPGEPEDPQQPTTPEDPQKPEGPNNQGGSGNGQSGTNGNGGASTTKPVKTGDAMSAVPSLLMCMAAAGVFVQLKKKKEEK